MKQKSIVPLAFLFTLLLAGCGEPPANVYRVTRLQTYLALADLGAGGDAGSGETDTLQGEDAGDGSDLAGGPAATPTPTPDPSAGSGGLTGGGGSSAGGGGTTTGGGGGNTSGGGGSTGGGGSSSGGGGGSGTPSTGGGGNAPTPTPGSPTAGATPTPTPSPGTTTDPLSGDEIAACSQTVGADPGKIRMIHAGQKLTVSGDAPAAIKVSGHQPAVDLMITGEAGKTLPGLCVFVTGDQASVDIWATIPIKATYYLGRGNLSNGVFRVGPLAEILAPFIANLGGHSPTFTVIGNGKHVCPAAAPGVSCTPVN